MMLKELDLRHWENKLYFVVKVFSFGMILHGPVI
jgi:hypothetical protein